MAISENALAWHRLRILRGKWHRAASLHARQRQPVAIIGESENQRKRRHGGSGVKYQHGENNESINSAAGARLAAMAVSGKWQA